MDQGNPYADLFILLEEFHLWQELARITRAERLALISCDFPELAELTKQKTSAFTSLAVTQQNRRKRLINSKETQQSGIPNARSQTQSEWNNLPQLTSISRIINGIRSLTDQVNDLALGNLALAESTVKQVWGLQDWIQYENRKSIPNLRTSLQAARDLTSERQPTLERQSEPRATDWSHSFTPTEIGFLRTLLPEQLPKVSTDK